MSLDASHLINPRTGLTLSLPQSVERAHPELWMAAVCGFLKVVIEQAGEDK